MNKLKIKNDKKAYISFINNKNIKKCILIQVFMANKLFYIEDKNYSMSVNINIYYIESNFIV